MATEELTLLKSIDVTLKHLLALAEARGRKSAAGPSIADDRDLDGQWGNPRIVAADPRDWAGDSMKGRTFSECPPAYLDLLAERFDYFAQKAEEEGKTTSAGKPVAPYNRKDAARARGWAARLRAGWSAPQSEPVAGAVEADEIAW